MIFLRRTEPEMVSCPLAETYPPPEDAIIVEARRRRRIRLDTAILFRFWGSKSPSWFLFVGPVMHAIPVLARNDFGASARQKLATRVDISCLIEGVA